MAETTGIAWCDSTWNPVRGCSRVSPGCGGPNHEGGCYAEKMAARFSDPGLWGHGFAERTAHGGRWTGKVELIPEMLDLPLRWKTPRKIFVNSTSDLFHENLPDAAIDRVFAVMALAPQHTFQVLTKRAKRMREYFATWPMDNNNWDRITDIAREIGYTVRGYRGSGGVSERPLRHVWLGISAEDQQRADERIPDLLATPAAIRFLSCEPLLGPLDLTAVRDQIAAHSFITRNALHSESTLNRGNVLPRLDWVIVGGESGPRARPFDLTWARSIQAQCKATKVACFIKQLGADPRIDGVQFPAERRMGGWDRAGADPQFWPEDLKQQDFPA